MNRYKDSIFVKVIIFIVLQISILSFVLSAVALVFNAGNGWYSQNEKDVRENILQNVMYDLEDSLISEIYNIRWNNAYLVYYMDPDAEPAPGIGYEILFEDGEDKYTGWRLHNEIDSALTVSDEDIYTKRSDHAFANDDTDCSLIITVVNPKATDLSPEELYGERLAAIYVLQTKVYDMRNMFIAIFIISAIVLVLSIVFIFQSAGIQRKNDSAFKKIPLDLLAVVVIVICILLIAFLAQLFYSEVSQDMIILMLLIVGIAISSSITGFMWMFIARARMGKWWHSTVIYALFKLIKKFLFSVAAVLRGVVKKLPLVWKCAAVTVVLSSIVCTTLLNVVWFNGSYGLYCVILIGLLTTIVCYIALCLQELAKGAETLAEGDFSHTISEKQMFGGLREHAKNLNHIKDGMTVAIEKRLESERFKTELITNVSHDIKTPLTSIINYVDLLKKEGVDGDRADEYLDVLERQSRRLKKLTEDIVEASKVSTGNIEINLEPCQVGILIEQTIGEYKEKAEKEKLHFVPKMPEKDLVIMADGRRMWRVFDNLLNNICKYAQPGTRVYISLEQDGADAVITFRNVSRYELDITEQELMERFVRGDKSRHTEGSGLGLSIARNLVELQGGSFDIYIDGDLFKVVMKFNISE